MSAKKLLLLVDGSSYLFRAFHALPQLTNSRGDPTGAVVGVINMLRKELRSYKPDYVAVVFDAPGKTFRDEIYPEYKAHRPPMPDELRTQIEPLYEIIRSLGLPLIIKEGVEADDVIGTLALQATEANLRTVISTGDKDLTQLVNENVSLINTMGDNATNEQGVIEKFGVRADQIIDYLALVGDTADNIPGVYKCGPKTAAKWLAEYGSLDNVMANAHKIKGKIGNYLRDGLKMLPTSKELVRIKTDVELSVKPVELVPQPQNQNQLHKLYQQIESNRLLATLDKADVEPEPQAPPTEVKYETILSQDVLDDWIDRLTKAELICFDTETTSLNYMLAELVGLSFSITAAEACYIPLAHSAPGTPDQLDRRTVLSRLKTLLEDPNKPKLGQNMKYDINVLANYGIEVRGVVFDTMLESYIYNSVATRHDMDSLAATYLNARTIKFEEIAGKGAKQLRFDQIPLEEAAQYAAEDADITLRLHQRLWPELKKQQGLTKVFSDIEIPLIPVLSKLERTGVKIDCAMLAQQSQDMAKGMVKLEQLAYEIAGYEFNMSSPKQIGEIFFNQLKLPVIAKTPKGEPSTAEHVLIELAEQGHQLPDVILKYRSFAKLRSTYTEKLPQMLDSTTGRLHTSYHQAVAATGRLSSTDPNLQNIPIKSQEGRRIRQAFIAEPGYKIIAADYSQIELRIMAHLSEDEALAKAFSQGADIHSATASEVFGVSPNAVTDEQRRSAKAINFGLMYGMSAFGLAKQLGVERAIAQKYIDLYFERYPGVHRFMEGIRTKAHEQGYVETLFGRRLYLPNIHSRNRQRRGAAERAAINAPMQGTAADIIKRAMIKVDQWIGEQQPDVKMIMQVHDELVFEVKESQLDSISQMIRMKMEQAAELAVPLVIDIGSGDNWDQAH